MKKKIFTVFLSVCLLLTLALPALAEAGNAETPLPGEWTTLYENTSRVTGGFSFTNKISQNAAGRRVESFAVETAAGGGVYPIVATADSLHEAMTAVELTAAAEGRGLNVLAAVNADFYYSSLKLPLGGAVVDGELIASNNDENLLAFTDSGAFFSEKPTIQITLHNQGGGDHYDDTAQSWVSNAGKDVRVNQLNKVRTANGGVFLYTTAYNPEHTVTTRDGWAVRFRVLSGKLTVSGSVELQVEEVIPSCTDIAVGEGYMVLTSALDGLYPQVYNDFSVGDRVTLTTVCSDPRLTEARWATGCGDLIVDGGEITDSAGWDKAISEAAHPRTAFGVKPDGSFAALVIDGRRSAYSVGAVMYELARELRDMGCEFAVNLDGGGSSVMMLRAPGEESCAVVNRPSDGSVRKGSTYILFVSDEQRTGEADTLHIEEDGRFILAGSSTLLTPFATDRAGLPAQMPENVVLTAQRGTIVDGVYTAGAEAGTDTITISTPDGVILGTGTLHVTDRLDSLNATDISTGRAPALDGLEPGDTVELAFSGKTLLRDVLMDNAGVTFTVTEGLGEITPDGSFTATGTSAAEGELTAAAGGVTLTFPVKLKLRYHDILGHWAQDYVSHLFDKNIVRKTEDDMFRPDEAMARWEFALILWRSVGSPVLDGECVFTDVPADSEYYEAVKWGNLIGLILGTEPDRFSSDDPISREQAFTLVYRLLTLFRKGLPETDLAVLDAFPDGGSVSEYAMDAVATLVSAGFVGGSDGYLLPQSSITRAELCKVTCEAVLGWSPPRPEEDAPGTPPAEEGETGESGGETEPGENTDSSEGDTN